MESFAFLTSRALSVADLATFIKSNDGHLIDPESGHGSIQSGIAAVYIGIEEEKHRDWERVRAIFPTAPTWLKSVVVLTVSRRDGSIELSFKVVDKMLEQWGGVIDWAGLDDWRKNYERWKTEQRNE